MDVKIIAVSLLLMVVGFRGVVKAVDVNLFISEYRGVPNHKTSEACKLQCGFDYKNFDSTGVMIMGDKNARGTGCGCRSLWLGYAGTIDVDSHFHMLKTQSYVQHWPSITVCHTDNAEYITLVPVLMSIGSEMTITFTPHSPWNVTVVQLLTQHDAALYISLRRNSLQMIVDTIISGSFILPLVITTVPFDDDVIQTLTVKVDTGGIAKLFYNSLAVGDYSFLVSPTDIRSLKILTTDSSEISVSRVDFKAGDDNLVVVGGGMVSIG